MGLFSGRLSCLLHDCRALLRDPREGARVYECEQSLLVAADHGAMQCWQWLKFTKILRINMAAIRPAYYQTSRISGL